jgi:hypothetical protein
MLIILMSSSSCKKSRINKHILLEMILKNPYFGTMLHHDRGVRVKKKELMSEKDP